MGQLPQQDQAATASGAFADKRRRLDGVTLNERQHCMTHNRDCPLNQFVHIDFSGLPCPDNSRANAKRKFEQGPSGILYLIWAKQHRQKETPLLIVENVPVSKLHVRSSVVSRPCCCKQEIRMPHDSAQDIKMTVLHDILGEDYQLYQFFVSPADAGYFGTQRSRTYIFFCHKRRCRHLCDIHEAYRKVTKTLRKHIYTEPHDYYVATDAEILVSAERVARCRKIPFRPVPWLLCVTCP